MHNDRVRSAGELKVIERVKKICRKLKEVDIVIDGFGHTTFKVAKKSFVLIGGGHDGDEWSMAIKADHDSQRELIRRGPYVRTPYIGQHGWVSISSNAKIEWDEIEELIFDGYNHAAPKRLRNHKE